MFQKPKKKKEKKVKKEKKEKRDKKKLLRADYEVAEGITTPSKEQVSPSQMDTPINVQFPVSFLLLQNFKIYWFIITRHNKLVIRKFNFKDIGVQ